MKKTLAIILILSMCLFAFVGCGGSSAGAADKPLVVGYSTSPASSHRSLLKPLMTRTLQQ